MTQINKKILKFAQIMIIDNAQSSLRRLVKILRDAGYHVRSVNTGEIALSSIEETIPDLILLDILLPGMDGHAVCEKLKSNPRTRDIPVIFLSALEDSRNILQGFAAGAVDYITKPFEPNEVLTRVHAHLRLRFMQTELESLNLALASEIEQRKNAQRELVLEKERFRIVLFSIGDGMIATDAAGMVTMLNDVAKDLTGWAGESAIGKPFSDVFYIVNEYSGERCEDIIQKVVDTGEITGLVNHTVLRSKNGTENPIADSAAPILDAEGNVSGVVLVFRDVTEDRLKQKEMEFISNHDPLTGLGNRRFFEDQIRWMDRESALPLTVIMGDVNSLKLTNDAFGHEMGDLLLQKAAEVLKSCCRGNDVICRHGGDEFVILLPNTIASEAEIIADDIRNAASHADIGIGPLSISIGWTVRSAMRESVSEVFKRAEDYMYKRKFSESSTIQMNFVENIMNTLNKGRASEKIHLKNGVEICGTLASALHLDEKEVRRVQTAYKLHDIGEITVEESILKKKSKLTDAEWVLIKRHPEVGYRILRTIPAYMEAADSVLSHHERWDGTGYPKGLDGNDIPLFSRIISVVDSYDAMISKRPFREAMSPDEAVSEIMKNAGTQFDPDIAKVFVEKVLHS